MRVLIQLKEKKYPDSYLFINGNNKYHVITHYDIENNTSTFESKTISLNLLDDNGLYEIRVGLLHVGYVRILKENYHIYNSDMDYRLKTDTFNAVILYILTVYG